MNPLVSTGSAGTRGATALSVNLNKVALLRNQRSLAIPSVTRCAVIALEAGASGITVHPRPDERHIRVSDVHELAALLRSQWPHAEFNIEGNPHHNLMDLVRAIKPEQATFVPDAQDQGTSDHGWNLPADAALLKPLIDEARALGVRVSLFMDPLSEAMAEVAALGADRVELYTEGYARAHLHRADAPLDHVLARYTASAQAALRCGLGVNAGHDLNRDNLTEFLRAVPGVQEVSIGHALIADALELGLAEAVRDYVRCIHRAHVPR